MEAFSMKSNLLRVKINSFKTETLNFGNEWNKNIYFGNEWNEINVKQIKIQQIAGLFYNFT